MSTTGVVRAVEVPENLDSDQEGDHGIHSRHLHAEHYADDEGKWVCRLEHVQSVLCDCVLREAVALEAEVPQQTDQEVARPCGEVPHAQVADVVLRVLVVLQNDDHAVVQEETQR